MYKVAIIWKQSTATLENSINEFIKDKKVIDIKFNTFTLFSGKYNDLRHNVYDRVMVIYEEEEN